MPYKPAKPCKNPRCPGLTYHWSGYCAKCLPAFMAERNERDRLRRAEEAKRPHMSQRPGYGPEWIKARERYHSSHPVCELCGRPTELIHHRKAVKQGGTHDQENLVALCNACHNAIEPRGWKQRVGRGT